MFKRILSWWDKKRTAKVSVVQKSKLTKKEMICNTKKDKIDERDYKYSVTSTEVTLPESYSIPNLPPIRQQGSIGSCASHAAIGAYEVQLLQRGQGYFIEGSELYHYYNVRKLISADYPNDSGMTLRDACKGLAQYNFGLELLCPYNTTKFNQEPSYLTYVFANLYKISRYESVFNTTALKKSLTENIPVICGISVNSTFYKLNKTNYIYDKIDGTGGGHAVLIIGYNDKKGTFILRNSWGSGFGNDGYFEIPYDKFTKYAWDWWRIVK